ncbi:MAG: fibronectin type III domain-containing protein [Treponemataceae bacterium]|nr:fibronectin type III domain-containing protein [Treponemataceae bacterium]
MKRQSIALSGGLVVSFFLIFPLAEAQQYPVLRLGGKEGWTRVQEWRGVREEIRGGASFLVLSSGSGEALLPASVDLALSFDDANPSRYRDRQGHYDLVVSSSVLTGGSSHAWRGAGAVIFGALEEPQENLGKDSNALQETVTTGPLNSSVGIRVVPRQDALFKGPRRIQDFSIEFWMYPYTMENGQQILDWSGIHQRPDGKQVFQRIRCQVTRNRLEWIFQDFFVSPDERQGSTVYLRGLTIPLPKSWSHHLIRYEAKTGLLEYLVNGQIEGVTYTTSTGREGGILYAPLVGRGGEFILGQRYTGALDEMYIHSTYVEQPLLSRLPPVAGYVVSRPFDLGATNSRLVRIEATASPKIEDRRVSSSAWLAPEIRLYVRMLDVPLEMGEKGWIPIYPGVPLGSEIPRGRYVQIRAEFYASSDGTQSPSLQEVRLFYEPDRPPPPPSQLVAIPRNGAVELRWKPSADTDVAGYVVYYGMASGEYFGTDAVQGPSPIRLGLETSVVIEGLQNGRVYYFAVAAYDNAQQPHEGELSREVAVRPGRTEP